MTTWTADRTEILVKLRKKHQPVSVMVERLGITRTAIMGKLFRLGLSVARVRNPAPTLTAPEPHSTRVGITLLQLTSKTCHWPLGDPQQSNFAFCGDVSLDGCPYCEAHAKIAYNKGGNIRVTMKASAYWKKRY
jgi:GcrA cell cycle regulator